MGDELMIAETEIATFRERWSIKKYFAANPRAFALFQTKLEEAEMWLNKCEELTGQATTPL